MAKYNLNNFKNNKAFIYQEELIDGKLIIGNKICININGEKLFELPQNDMFISEFDDEDVAFVIGGEKLNNLQALMNNKGEFLTDFIYDSIYAGSEEGLFEVKRKGKQGHIDITGKEIIPCMYDDGNYFSEGVASVCLNNKWGMIDYYNNIVVPFEYDKIYICKNNRIDAQKNGKWGLIDKNNKIVIKFLYDDIYSLCSRNCLIYPVLKSNKWGLIDKYGNLIEDFIYDKCQIISDNEDNIGEFIALSKNNKQAIYSTSKQMFITDFIYDYIDYLQENRFFVLKDNKSGFVDTNGENIVPCMYDKKSYHNFNEGLCAVSQNDKYGMIDLNGNLVIPFEYQKLNNCHEGLILATNTNKQTGYLNKRGETVIPFEKYHCIGDFHCGLAQVLSKETGRAYINKTGKIFE